MVCQGSNSVAKIFECFPANMDSIKKHWRLDNISLAITVAVSAAIFASVLAAAP